MGAGPEKRKTAPTGAVASPPPSVRNPRPRLPATFPADRLSADWDRGQPLRPERTVSGVIGAFSPRDLPDDVWARVQVFVRDVITASAPARPFMADIQMSVVAQLAAWADRIGLPLEPAVVLHPETIERFFISGAAHLKEGSRLNYRTQLWKVGRAVLGPELFPPKPPPMQRLEVLPPYDDTDVAALVSWARGLTTIHRRRNARALLAIGLGAGLAPEEVQRLVGTDVVNDGDVVVVHVIGRRPRTVPVVAEWADDVVALARESGERPFFCPERRRIARNELIKFIEGCSGEEGPRFTVLRLRVSWIVHHLSVGTHLRVLEDIAGVRATQVVKYLRYVPMPEVDHLSGYRPRPPGGAGQQ